MNIFMQNDVGILFLSFFTLNVDSLGTRYFQLFTTSSYPQVIAVALNEVTF